MNDLFLKLLENSMIVSAAAILFLLLSRLLRSKTPPMLRRLCWIILFLCFLIPVRPTFITVTIPQESNNEALTVLYSQLHEIRMMFDNDEHVPISSGDILAQETQGDGSRVPDQTSVHESLENNSPVFLRDIASIILYTWFLGMFISLLVYTTGYIRFIRGIKRPSIKVVGSVLNDIIDDVRCEIGLKRDIKLAICPIIGTPVVAGFFRPVIYLPDETINYRELRFILIHEATHIKNGDIWIKLLSLSVMIIHWFNPVVYLMNRAMLIESELACDTGVLRYAGEEQRLQYCQTVFRTAKRSWQPASMLASAFSDSGKTLRRRLFAIINRNNTRRWIMICCVLILMLVIPVAILVGFDTMPVDEKKTDELVIYIPPLSSNGLITAVDVYKEMYPDVNVIVETPNEYDYEVYSSRVSSDMMAGAGSDVVFLYGLLDLELNKMLDKGMFLDLNEFVESDNDFHLDEYVKTVINSGLYNGKRYIMPYTYIAPVFIASTNVLNKIGFDLSQNADFVSFVSEAMRCLPNAQKNPLFQSMFNNYLWSDLTQFIGLSLVDFETGEVTFDDEKLKTLLDAYKPYYHIDSDISRFVSNNIGDSLLSGALSFNIELVPHSFFDRASLIKTESDFEMLTIPGINGKINSRAWDTAAIRADSPNKVNAWNFIKLLLSPQMQSNADITSVWKPVHKESLIRKVEMDWYYYNGEGLTASGDTITYTRSSETEMQMYLNAIMEVEHCFAFDSRAVRKIVHEHVNAFFEGNISNETAVNELRNQLMLYLSE